MTSEERTLFKQLLDQQKVIDARLARLLALLEDQGASAVRRSIQRSMRELPMQEAAAKISQDIEDAIRGGRRKGNRKKAL